MEYLLNEYFPEVDRNKIVEDIRYILRLIDKNEKILFRSLDYLVSSESLNYDLSKVAMFWINLDLLTFDKKILNHNLYYWDESLDRIIEEPLSFIPAIKCENKEQLKQINNSFISNLLNLNRRKIYSHLISLLIKEGTSLEDFYKETKDNLFVFDINSFNNFFKDKDFNIQIYPKVLLSRLLSYLIRPGVKGYLEMIDSQKFIIKVEKEEKIIF